MAGNANSGQRKDKMFREALHRAIKRIDDGKDPRLDRIAEQVIKQALAGELAAIKEIADRLDGKPAQAHVGDADEAPIQHTVKFRWDD